MAENGVLLIPFDQWDADTLEDYLYLCRLNFPVRLKYQMDIKESLKRWALDEE